MALLPCELQKVLLPKHTVGAALPEQFQFLHQFFRPHFVLRLQGQHADFHTVQTGARYYELTCGFDSLS